MYIFEKTSRKPRSNLCEQCKEKEENGDCHCPELMHVTPEPELRREVSNVDVTSRELDEFPK